MTQTRTNTSVLAHSPVERARTFYDCVDRGDIPAIAALFAQHATYHRPGYEPFLGPAGMARFYGAERKIRDGRHRLEWVVAADGQVAVRGSFRGTLRNGDPIELRFADFFEVGQDGLFTRRDTFFFSPLA
jgi:ketosteroid isomerase-like protein